MAAPESPRVTICQVLHSLNIGGAEVLAARIARSLSHEFQFVFACLDELGVMGEQLRSDGFTVEVIGRGAGFDIGCVRRLAEFSRKHQVRLIHAHQYTPFFYSRAPGVFQRRPPVLFNEHGRFHPDMPSRKRMLFNRLTLRTMDRVVSVGDAVRQALIDNEGIPASRIEVIYNGIDLSANAESTAVRDAMRRELRLADDAFVIIQVARLDPIKDHSTALRTIRCVMQDHPHVKLLIVGDGSERHRIEQEIEQQGLADFVTMLGQRSDIPELLAACDAFLLTSLSEGIPVTLIEAMGAQLPIVSTRAGGCAEVVVEGETGLLTPPSDHDALADAILSLINDREKCFAIGQQGRRRAEELFSEQNMHDAYVRLYREMIHDK